MGIEEDADLKRSEPLKGPFDNPVDNALTTADLLLTPIAPDEVAVLIIAETDESDSSVTSESSTSSESEIEQSANVRFSPPVYIQRYCKVRQTLEDLMRSAKFVDVNVTTGKTIMEVGCAEFGMMTHFKHMLEIGKLIFLDLDEGLMKEKLSTLRPLPAEYLCRTTRPQPLQVEAHAGCITKVDAELNLANPDIFAIVGIEIIEHLHPEVLRGFEETVFGIYSPMIVIVTTPNSDFNEVFNLPPGKFRHWDHKFEWTRSEFDSWCKKIVSEFPDYAYRTEGICEGPEGTSHLGCVSQMAVFEKKEVVVGQRKTVPEHLSFRVKERAYKLLSSIEFPNYVETRSTEEIMLHEFLYYVNNYVMTSSAIDQYLYDEVAHVPVSLKTFQNIPAIPKEVREDQNRWKSVLQEAGYEVKEEGEELNVVLDVKAFAEMMETDSSDEEGYSDGEPQEQNSPANNSSSAILDAEDEAWD